MILWFLLAAVIIVADQALKIIVSSNMELFESFEAIPRLFNITYVQNKGAAFSIMSNYTWVLSLLSVIFCVVILTYIIFKKPENKLFMLSLIMVFAGALGNAIDRIALGYVVDFIETAFIDFPIFNLADISITVGAVLLVIYEIFFDRQENKNE